LTSVIAYAELLDDASSKLSTAQRGEFLRRLRGEANQLLSIIDDILDLSRLETGKLVLQRSNVAVNDVVHSAVECARSHADKLSVRLVEELDAETGAAAIDEVKIRQILLNLLIYAVKFS